MTPALLSDIQAKSGMYLLPQVLLFSNTKNRTIQNGEQFHTYFNRRRLLKKKILGSSILILKKKNLVRKT